MKTIGKTLILLAILMFTGGFFTLFWEEVTGEVAEYETLAKTYTGNGGVAARGATYRGGATELAYITYHYTNETTQHTGHSIRFSGGSSSLKSADAYTRPAIRVYYSRTFPTLSILDRNIYFFMPFLLTLFGFGLIEMHKWFAKHARPSKKYR
ncbi:hypothetical protein [Pseudomonas sp. URMO17WK12:I2]|uniref:hypothetical protein n=1 Tax=Pseudomonas sp. URMO17WK12:I2 TaxID=1261623 RepID=UPI0011B5DBBF|nr:hypothetical protein [Pseudomonas sp. URMO17WK12:I2]